MKRTPIRVLLVEDNPGDARLIQEAFRDAGGTACELEWCDRLSAALERLAKGGVDVVLLDLSLPDGHGLDTFAKTVVEAPQVPIVVLTGLDDERVAAEAVRMGAQDYLVKGRVDGELLVRALRYAIERHRLQDELRRLAVGEDRDRIATELHDDVIQTLVGLGLRLNDLAETTPDEDVNCALRGAAGELGRLTARVRSYIYELGDRSAAPLERILHGLAGWFREQYGLSIAVDVDARWAAALEPRAETVVQLFREALSNVGRHALAKTCSLSLKRAGHAVVLEVADDGCGFSPEATAGSGRGLGNLRKRAASLGGTIEIESAPGRGTRVRVTISP